MILWFVILSQRFCSDPKSRSDNLPYSIFLLNHNQYTFLNGLDFFLKTIDSKLATKLAFKFFYLWTSYKYIAFQ